MKKATRRQVSTPIGRLWATQRAAAILSIVAESLVGNDQGWS